MNELQIRLSGDITALQSALNKAKATIKSFEESTDKESEKGNVGFKRKIGLIEQLTNKAKNLRTALSQATNETQVAKYNSQLEETSRELTRLNALGRSVSSNLGSTANGFGQVARQGANANGVAIEFNRVIQDAPFGLIGIGNNLQQLAGSFANVSQQAGGTGAAIKASLASIISPVNLGLLAISALTAGFTAYQMGAFDSLFATEDLGKSVADAAQKLEDYRNSLDAVTRASIEGAASGEKEVQTFNNLRLQAENANIPLKTRIEAVKELQSKFPDYLGKLTQEQILTGNVGTAYEDLTAQIIATAKARAFSDEIAKNSIKLLTLEDQLAKNKNEQEKLALVTSQKAVQISGTGLSVVTEQDRAQRKIKELQEEQLGILEQILPIKEDENRLTQAINGQLEQGAKFTETQIKKVKELKDEYEALNQILITRNIEFEAENSLANFSKNIGKVLKPDEGDKPIIDLPIDINFIPEGLNNELGLIQQLQAQIQSINALRDVATDPTRIQAYNEQLKALQAQLGVFTGAQNSIVDANRVIGDSFSALGTIIGANLETSNKALNGFIRVVLSSAPKIIQAILAQAAAKKAADAQTVSSNVQVAASEGIAVGAKAANALGPVGLALLPVFIGGALAIISGAFSSIGKGGVGGGGGGSIPASGRPPQIFTNANTVTPPSPNIPSPSGSIDFDKAQGRLDARVSGEDIVFVYDRYKERQKGGG